MSQASDIHATSIVVVSKRSVPMHLNSSHLCPQYFNFAPGLWPCKRAANLFASRWQWTSPGSTTVMKPFLKRYPQLNDLLQREFDTSKSAESPDFSSVARRSAQLNGHRHLQGRQREESEPQQKRLRNRPSRSALVIICPFNLNGRAAERGCRSIPGEFEESVVSLCQWTHSASRSSTVPRPGCLWGCGKAPRACQFNCTDNPNESYTRPCTFWRMDGQQRHSHSLCLHRKMVSGRHHRFSFTFPYHNSSNSICIHLHFNFNAYNTVAYRQPDDRRTEVWSAFSRRPDRFIAALQRWKLRRRPESWEIDWSQTQKNGQVGSEDQCSLVHLDLPILNTRDIYIIYIYI